MRKLIVPFTLALAFSTNIANAQSYGQKLLMDNVQLTNKDYQKFVQPCCLHLSIIPAPPPIYTPPAPSYTPSVNNYAPRYHCTGHGDCNASAN